MAISSRVPNPSENVNSETTSFTKPPTSSIKPPGSDTSIDNKQNIKISGLDSFRQRLHATGISERASKLISSTRRQGSLSNYNSPCPKWASLCGEIKIDPFRCAIGKVLDYLVTCLIQVLSIEHLAFTGLQYLLIMNMLPTSQLASITCMCF